MSAQRRARPRAFPKEGMRPAAGSLGQVVNVGSASRESIAAPPDSKPGPGWCVPGQEWRRGIRAAGVCRAAGTCPHAGPRGRMSETLIGSPGRSRRGVGVRAEGRGRYRAARLRRPTDTGATRVQRPSPTSAGRVAPRGTRPPPASMRAACGRTPHPMRSRDLFCRNRLRCKGFGLRTVGRPVSRASPAVSRWSLLSRLHPEVDHQREMIQPQFPTHLIVRVNRHVIAD